MGICTSVLPLICKRIAQHREGQVPATAHRLPVSLEYYEACRSESGARLRERQRKTGFGRAYLKRRLRQVHAGC
jgi:putative endonuclease